MTDIMDDLATAQVELERQQQWGQNRTDLAMEAMLSFAQKAIMEFDALNARVAALEAKVP